MTAIDLNIPVLTTPRLILRGHKLEDFDAMVATMSDPVARKYIHGPVLTREDYWAKFVRQFGMWALRGYGMWAVEEKETGAYIGTVGAFEVKRDMNPPLEDMPEAGWTLAVSSHGKGYATEAVRAALECLDVRLSHPKMFCIIEPANIASIRVAEKCGFRPYGETIYKEEPTSIFVRESN